MEMEFVREVMKKPKLSTAYAVAKLLGCAPNLVSTWIGKNKERTQVEGIKLKYLVKLRQVSGMTWAQFGKLLDLEFLDRKKLE